MDIEGLWDHQNPAESEQRFRQALEQADGNDALILHTQIARTFGIRSNFDQAQRILQAVKPQLPQATAEAQTHWWLEWGRTFCSATHSPESQNDAVRAEARGAFMRAFKIAEQAKLDALAVDALHMMAFVDTEPAKLLEWNLKTLTYMEASPDPKAKRWEASLRNNVGCALHQVGRLAEALEQFKLVLALREHQGNSFNIRVAHWMIAWTLRGLGNTTEALKIQLRLEHEFDADGQPDPHVYAEIATLYGLQGNSAQAALYRSKHRAST